MDDRRRPGHARPMAEARPLERPLEPRGRATRSLPISPTVILVAIALIGSTAFVLYTLTVREASQIPLLATGVLVLGVVFGAIAVLGLRAAWASSVHGRDGRAFGHAVVGGIASFIAAGCFAGAIILAMLSQTPAA